MRSHIIEHTGDVRIQAMSRIQVMLECGVGMEPDPSLALAEMCCCVFDCAQDQCSVDRSVDRFRIDCVDAQTWCMLTQGSGVRAGGRRCWCRRHSRRQCWQPARSGAPTCSLWWWAPMRQLQPWTTQLPHTCQWPLIRSTAARRSCSRRRNGGGTRTVGNQTVSTWHWVCHWPQSITEAAWHVGRATDPCRAFETRAVKRYFMTFGPVCNAQARSCSRPPALRQARRCRRTSGTCMWSHRPTAGSISSAAPSMHWTHSDAWSS